MKYTILYFDLDNTLLDFSAAERNAICKLLERCGILPKQEYVMMYSRINQCFWERFELGEIKRDDIFEGRFVKFTESLGIKADTAKMSADYFALLSCECSMVPDADNVLNYVKRKGYTVCVTTNGVAKTQHRRIRESGIQKYFDYVFISEETGHKKPEKEYFQYVFDHTPEKDKSRILVIGDSQSSDILGGINFGIDTCWLNPKGQKAKYTPTYQISNISELIGIL